VKALSIVSPNGMRIATGEKTLEVRRWSPDISAQEPMPTSRRSVPSRLTAISW